jgi:hypothetical protein
VSDLVSELITEGLVEEIGQGQSNGGKRPRCEIHCRSTLPDQRRPGFHMNLKARGQPARPDHLQTSVHVGDSNGQAALKLVYELIDG